MVGNHGVSRLPVLSPIWDIQKLICFLFILYVLPWISFIQKLLFVLFILRIYTVYLHTSEKTYFWGTDMPRCRFDCHLTVVRGGNDGSQLCFGFTCTRASRSTESLCEWRPVWVGWFFKRCEMKPDHLKVLGKGWSFELSTHFHHFGLPGPQLFVTVNGKLRAGFWREKWQAKPIPQLCFFLFLWRIRSNPNHLIGMTHKYHADPDGNIHRQWWSTWGFWRS